MTRSLCGHFTGQESDCATAAEQELRDPALTPLSVFDTVH